MTRQHNASAARLRAFVNRIERLDEDIDERNQDKAEVYKEAKGEGFDLPVLRRLISDRRKMSKDPAKFDEQNEILQMYQAAMGSGTPRATRAPTTQAAEFDPATGEITEMGEARAVDGVANAETSSSEALCEHGAGAPMHPMDPAPQSDQVLYADGSVFGGEHDAPRHATAPYRVTDPAPVPAAPDPELSPLIADAAARQAAARRLLGQAEAAE